MSLTPSDVAQSQNLNVPAMYIVSSVSCFAAAAVSVYTGSVIVGLESSVTTTFSPASDHEMYDGLR